MKKIWLALCLALVLTCSSAIPLLCAQTPTATEHKKEELTLQRILTILGGIKGHKQVNPDTLKEIVNKLVDVKKGLPPEKFWRDVSAMKMPEGLELRHVLMKIKSDIALHLGSNGLQMVFGKQYPQGGSYVEGVLLNHRKKIVKDAIHTAIKKVAATKPKYSAFYSEVGSWSSENIKQMTFAGDIDFNFLCGDMKTALALKKAFDNDIQQKFGRTPEDLDIPCTVHGSATGEVYVGLHGQKFVEAEMKGRNVKTISFGDNGKPVGVIEESHMDFDEAKNIMLLEAELSKSPMPDVEKLHVKTQPGLTLEMIRHFEHDIVKQNVHTELDSFIKASKYLDRHYKSLVAEAGEGAVKNKTLRNFARDLVANKKSPRIQVELIRSYFKTIKKPLPFEVDLAPNQIGKSGGRIKANKQIIDTFWEQCRTTMWETANAKIKEVTAELNSKARGLGKNSAAEAKALNDEISRYQQMLEVEDGVLHHEKFGIAEQLNPQYKKNIETFRKTIKKARVKMVQQKLLKSFDPTTQGVYNLVEGLAETKTPTSTRMASATLLLSSLESLNSGVDTVNNTLDFIDDGLMNTLRHGAANDYNALLQQGQKLHWRAEVNQFLKGTGLEIDRDVAREQELFQARSQQLIAKTSEKLTDNLKSNIVSRGAKWLGSKGNTALGHIQSVNNTFNQSVSNSRAGQTMMKGMMVYNLSQELPVYWDAMLNDDWNKLATELFRRRVPFGSAVENYMMGNYWGAGWDAVTTIIPPTALLSVSKTLATELVNAADETGWSIELDEFIDDLYNDADFQIVQVETTGDKLKVSEWKLINVNLDNQKYNLDEVIQTSIEASREMAQCLKKPSQQRTSCWPFEKENPLFKTWKREIAFRENFTKADPWIQLIEEMEKNKIVGSKMKDLYYYQKQQRYEELKVNFLIHTKEKLEQRRAGEQALISGNLPALEEELTKIAEKLDIAPQVQKFLDDTFGGEMWQGLTKGKEMIIGAIFRGDDDIWDIYKERATVITEALKVYKHIWEGRKAAEAILTYKHRDQGLRLATGPLFLSGDAAKDEAAVEKWFQLPQQVKDQMLETLIDIKIDAEADPVALILDDGAYDRDILEQLIYHATFKEMWKHVFNQPQTQKMNSSVEKADSETGKTEETEQDHALKRFKMHEEMVEKLINDFRSHYGLEETGPLSKLQQQNNLAMQLAAEICADGTTVATNLDENRAAIESTREVFYSYEKSLQEIVKLARNLDSIKKSLTEKHQTAEGLAIGIGDDTSLAGARKDVVCQAADALKQCRSNTERDRLAATATAAHVDIKPAFERARANSLKLEGLDGDVKSTLEKLTKAQQTVTHLDKVPAELDAAKETIKQNLTAAETLLTTDTETKLPEMAEIVTTAEGVADELRRTLTPPADAEEQKKIDALLGQISSYQTKASGCVDTQTTRLSSEKAQSEAFLNRYSKLEINVNRIKKAFEADSEGNTNPVFAEALEKANLADLLISMGEGYIKNCTRHLLIAKVCMNVVDQLKIVDYSSTMPNIVGLNCQEGANIVAGSDLLYQIVSTGKAPHPDWEYCVDSTDPPAGEEVSKKEGSVLISCFEELDIPLYLSTVDCSWLPGGTAVYNPGKHVGVCDCINGSVFNTAKTRCINCDEYFQAMVGAFNAGDLDTAQAWVDESRRCPWVADAQGQINEERHRRLCAQLSGNILSACQSGNARAANGALGDAYNQKCSVDPQLQQWVVNLVNAYNQNIREQQAQRQAQNQRNMQNFLNLIAQGLNAAARNHPNKPTPAPSPTPSPNRSSGSNRSSSSQSSGGGDDPCAKCPNSVCIMGVCAHSSGGSQ